jgi:amidophosphoribosyltransferase
MRKDFPAMTNPVAAPPCDATPESGLHEACGLFGIYNDSKTEVGSIAYHGLYALQHRGQESCGIAINDDGVIVGVKDAGLVGEVFTREVLESLPRGNMAIGHCLYGAPDVNTPINAQPLIVRHIKGNMAIGHNGALTNASQLREELELTGAIFQTASDAEVIAYIITRERLTAASIEEAVTRAMYKLAGAYSLVIMSPKKLLAARDPRGFRPLCIGRIDNSFVIASESCALDGIGARFVRNVKPGEIILIDENGMKSIEEHCPPEQDLKKHTSMCVFEYIYFARPDSVIDGSSVHVARKRAGAILAQTHPVDADVVIGVPDSGLDAAIGYAHEAGIPYDMGLLKNKYIGRSFIVPTQVQRESVLRIKLNAISSTVKGKRVVMIDDSIVRGTTSRRIVHMLRIAGAVEVHMRISAPPFAHPCYFGTDIKSRNNLIAANHSTEEIARIIGVDSLGFLPIDRVNDLAALTPLGFCNGCFTGDYPIPPPEQDSDQIAKYAKPLKSGGDNTKKDNKDE